MRACVHACVCMLGVGWRDNIYCTSSKIPTYTESLCFHDKKFLQAQTTIEQDHHPSWHCSKTPPQLMHACTASTDIAGHPDYLRSDLLRCLLLLPLRRRQRPSLTQILQTFMRIKEEADKREEAEMRQTLCVYVREGMRMPFRWLRQAGASFTSTSDCLTKQCTSKATDCCDYT